MLNDEAVYMCAHVFVVRFLHGTLDLMVLSNIIMCMLYTAVSGKYERRRGRAEAKIKLVVFTVIINPAVYLSNEGD